MPADGEICFDTVMLAVIAEYGPIADSRERNDRWDRTGDWGVCSLQMGIPRVCFPGRQEDVACNRYKSGLVSTSSFPRPAALRAATNLAMPLKSADHCPRHIRFGSRRCPRNSSPTENSPYTGRDGIIEQHFVRQITRQVQLFRRLVDQGIVEEGIGDVTCPGYDTCLSAGSPCPHPQTSLNVPIEQGFLDPTRSSDN